MSNVLDYLQPRLQEMVEFLRVLVECESPTDNKEAVDKFANLLVEKLRDFPNADHDDGPDALELAVRLAGEMLRNRAAQVEGEPASSPYPPPRIPWGWPY